jgi:phage terminase large subunit GpA-like protein
VDYNAWPDPKRKYFRMKEVPGTLMKRHRGAGLEGAIHAGLDELVNFLMDCEWSSESGSTLRIGRILIDYGWGETSTTVLEFCRRSPHGAIILPAKGKGIGIKSNPMEEWPHHEGEIRGHHWIVARAKAAKGKKAGRETQRITVDTNYWKTMLHERLAYAAGDAGGLTLFGQASDHQMLAQHLLAEARVRKALPGRTVDEWSLSPEKPDNHLGDCIVGNFVAASAQGAVISVRISEATRQARKKLAKAAKAKKAGRPKVRYFQ